MNKSDATHSILKQFKNISFLCVFAHCSYDKQSSILHSTHYLSTNTNQVHIKHASATMAQLVTNRTPALKSHPRHKQ